MREKNVFIPQQRNRDYCSKYVTEPKFEPRCMCDSLNCENQNKEALDTLARGGTVEIVLHDEDKGEQIIIETIKGYEHVKPIGVWTK